VLGGREGTRFSEKLLEMCQFSLKIYDALLIGSIQRHAVRRQRKLWVCWHTWKGGEGGMFGAVGHPNAVIES
jgi:hypothetical protein